MNVTNWMEGFSMRCEELYRLLSIYWRQDDRDIAFNLIPAHIHTCQSCARGLTLLTHALLSDDTLTCEQCRARFPAYYEATHPDHPLVSLSEVEMAEVAIHLGNCPACREQYKELERLSQLEECDEVVDR